MLTHLHFNLPGDPGIYLGDAIQAHYGEPGNIEAALYKMFIVDGVKHITLTFPQGSSPEIVTVASKYMDYQADPNELARHEVSGADLYFGMNGGDYNLSFAWQL